MFIKHLICSFSAMLFLAVVTLRAETDKPRNVLAPKSGPPKTTDTKSEPEEPRPRESYTRKEHSEALAAYLARARRNSEKRQKQELPLTLVVLKPGESRMVTTVLNGPIGGRQQLQYFSESFPYPDEQTTRPNAGDFGDFAEFHRHGFRVEAAETHSDGVLQQLRQAGRHRYAALTHRFTADEEAAPGTHTVYVHWVAGTGRQTRRRIAFCVVITP